MAKQQSKRRRKRYDPGSAYAGDVRPTGVLGFLSSAQMIRVIFIGMALALTAGGAAAVFGGNIFRQSGSNQDFVVPDEEQANPTEDPGALIDVRQYDAPPAFAIDPDARYVATIKTDLGDIEVELLASQAPETVNNFVFLAREGFYDGLIFHYVASGFSATAGDPACTADASGSACRGSGGPGYDLTEDAPGEFEKGSLGMANGSQFFIALTASQQFEEFSPFGIITSGLDVAEQLAVNTTIQAIEIREQ